MAVELLDPQKQEVLEGLRGLVAQAEEGLLDGLMVMYRETDGQWWHHRLGAVDVGVFTEIFWEMQIDMIREDVYDRVLEQLTFEAEE